MYKGYRDAIDLNADELLELKDRLYWDNYLDYNNDLEFMTDEQKAIVDNATSPDDIPDEIIFDVYGDILFVEEDFWCNIQDRN